MSSLGNERPRIDHQGLSGQILLSPSSPSVAGPGEQWKEDYAQKRTRVDAIQDKLWKLIAWQATGARLSPGDVQNTRRYSKQLSKIQKLGRTHGHIVRDIARDLDKLLDWESIKGNTGKGGNYNYWAYSGQLWPDAADNTRPMDELQQSLLGPSVGQGSLLGPSVGQGRAFAPPFNVQPAPAPARYPQIAVPPLNVQPAPAPARYPQTAVPQFNDQRLIKQLHPAGDPHGKLPPMPSVAPPFNVQPAPAPARYPQTAVPQF